MVVAQRQLGPHVTVLFGHEQGKYPDGNCVVVRGARRSVAIDPTLSVRAMDPPLAVDLVLLTHTHEDHAAGLAAVRTGEIRVHELDLAALRDVDDLMRLYGIPEDGWPQMRELVEGRFEFLGWPEAQGLRGGDVFDLGDVTVTALHAPGHTAGHTVYLIESADGTRVVVTGDIDLSTFGPYYGDATSNLADFRRSLAAVATLDARVWVTSHHRAVITDRAAFLDQLAAFTAKLDEREARLLAMLAPGPQAMGDLVRQRLLYPPEHDALWVGFVEQRSIQMHLDELQADGRVRQGDDGRFALA